MCLSKVSRHNSKMERKKMHRDKKREPSGMPRRCRIERGIFPTKSKASIILQEPISITCIAMEKPFCLHDGWVTQRQRLKSCILHPLPPFFQFLMSFNPFNSLTCHNVLDFLSKQMLLQGYSLQALLGHG